MHFDRLTTEQLYVLSNNKAHLKFIRKGAMAELQKRGFTSNSEVSLSFIYQQEVQSLNGSLPVFIKIILFFIPIVPFSSIVLAIVGIVAASFLDQQQKRKWKQCWVYVTSGYVVWTVIVLLVALIY